MIFNNAKKFILLESSLKTKVMDKDNGWEKFPTLGMHVCMAFLP
jgi:hypothetical protein